MIYFPAIAVLLLEPYAVNLATATVFVAGQPMTKPKA